MLAVLIVTSCLLSLTPAAGAAAGGEAGSGTTEAPGDIAADPVATAAFLDPAVQQLLQLRPDLEVGSTPPPSGSGPRRDVVVPIQESGFGRIVGQVTVSSDGTIVDRDLPSPEEALQLTSKSEAIRAARADEEVRATVVAEGLDPGTARWTAAIDNDSRNWEVDVRAARGEPIAVRVDVPDISGTVESIWTGHQIAWTMARGDRDSFGGSVNEWWIWYSFALGFVLLLMRPGQLWSWYTADLLVLVGFSVSHEAFRAGAIDWSVALALPPLVYLAARFSALGYGRGWGSAQGAELPVTEQFGTGLRRGWSWVRTRLQPWPPAWLCWIVAVLAAGVRYGLHYQDGGVIDVGYAGVIGADRILDGSTPYGTMPDDNPHGDTYGPLNYLLYIPAVLIWPWSGEWDRLESAHAVAITADVLCVALLAIVAWRWLGPRAAALASAAWMLWPYTLFAMNTSSNDLLVGFLLLAAIALLPRPVLRGAAIGLAAAVKFVPLLALGAVAHVGAERRLRQSLLVGLGATATVAATITGLALLDGGLPRFWEATFGFQLDRPSPFSVWGYWDLAWLQRILQALLLLGAAAIVLWPAQRSRWQSAALVVAVMAALQVTLQHWFYLYLAWIAPLLILVLVGLRASLDGYGWPRSMFVGVAREPTRQRPDGPPASSE